MSELFKQVFDNSKKRLERIRKIENLKDIVRFKEVLREAENGDIPKIDKSFLPELLNLLGYLEKYNKNDKLEGMVLRDENGGIEIEKTKYILIIEYYKEYGFILAVEEVFYLLKYLEYKDLIVVLEYPGYNDKTMKEGYYLIKDYDNLIDELKRLIKSFE